MEQWLHDASVKTGVKIIASTGFHKLDFYPEDHWIRSFDVPALTRIFAGEILEGMYTDANRGLPGERMHSRAGMIKTAIGNAPLGGRYRELYSAAAAAAVQTGVPMLCHIEPSANAVAIVEFLAAAGVPTESIILCHLDRTVGDGWPHFTVAKSGVYLEFDTIGRFKYHTDEAEIDLIVKLIGLGCEDRILIGLDSTRARMKSYGGTIGLDYLLRTFIPLLRQRGVSPTIIDKLTIHNPSRALSCRAVLRTSGDAAL
jgi:phosphotriesterase-related protein